MQIIPVIDIRKGIVVHASGGDREAYLPLKSVLTDSHEVEQVIEDMLSWYPFQQFYIADLDAIETGLHRPDFYMSLCKRFADVDIWLDAGIKNETDMQRYLLADNFKIVVGSETLTTVSLLETKAWRPSLILSIDSRKGMLLGDQQLLRDDGVWTDKTIVMDLDVVGADKGPSYDRLQKFMAKRPDIAWYAAGGVRHSADLKQLREMKVAGSLIASALHTGKLDKTILHEMEQVHRPS